MDLHQIYWFIKLGKPKYRATIYEIRNDTGKYVKEPVFFLSTGRCGTKWFSELIRKDKRFAVFHQPVPSLAIQGKMVYESFKKEGNKLPENEKEFIKEIFWSAREDHLRYTYKTARRYVETNNYITFFAPVLYELFPDARFIHLIRHPGEFIRSGISRNYYDGSVHDQMRLFPVSGPYAERWDQLSSIGKIAWLWSETNSFIRDFTAKLPGSNYHVLNFNNLGMDSVMELCEFLHVEISRKTIGKNIPKPKNIQHQYKMKPYEMWEEEEKLLVEEITRDHNETYGYTF